MTYDQFAWVWTATYLPVIWVWAFFRPWNILGLQYQKSDKWKRRRKKVKEAVKRMGHRLVPVPVPA